ncbi:ephexin-1 [Danio aesculapii]|uniref:ephexin-1 n=1 Tax=Danio aesculapii TaxID=1142201 RepID=UPI0024C0CEEB|nr:ephexin-1 [Danio aesculapii]XP_056315943.1 ephexin-1 [Danio aesculapii]
MPGPDGNSALDPCKNDAVPKSFYPPKPSFNSEKWHKASDLILRRDDQKKIHCCWASQHSTPAAQNIHQRAANVGLISPTRIKPIPKPRLLRSQSHADQPPSLNDSNMDCFASASDGKNNDTHLENWHIQPKTTSHKSKRVPPSIPVPARPLPKEPEQVISVMASTNDNDEGVYMDIDSSPTQSECSSLTVVHHTQSGSEVCCDDRPILPLCLSKPNPALKIQNKNNVDHNEARSFNNTIKDNLVSELQKRFSGSIKERDLSTKKPNVLQAKGDCSPKLFSSSHLEMISMLFHMKKLTEVDRPLKTVAIPAVSNGESPEDISSVVKYQETEMENLNESSQKTPKVLPLPGLVDKLIKNPSNKNFMCGDNMKKPLEQLWQEQSIVRNSGILSRLNMEQLRLQEHLYEVVTSEQVYLQSLAMTVEHFQESSVLKEALAPRDRKSLFSSIAKIKEISESFMDAMLLALSSSVICDGVCDVVHQYALGPFDAYITYIRNMPYQEQTLHNLGKESPQILEILHKLQEDPRCNRLPLKSFLSLPFQRITRLKILMETIHKKAVPGSDCGSAALRALTEISKLLEACNWQVGRMKQMEEIVQIANKIEFACKALPLVSSSRWLVKQGDLLQISSKENMFGQRKLCPVLLLLFNDLLLVANRKGLHRFVVHDYVHRSLMEVTEGKDLEEELEGCELNRIFQLTLLHNHRSTTSQLLLQTNSETEKDLWVELLGGRRDGQDTVYEEWDCPQVRCVEVCAGQQRGELSLQQGDLINVIQKTTDGFLEGRRVRDGQRGWFSASCVVEITNEHVQRRHLRQRYHVLQTATRLLKQRNRDIEQTTTKCLK